MMSFAKIDVGSIEGFWEANFEFVPTGPQSKKFALSGMDTKCFLYNSGSMLPNIGSGQASSIFFFVVVLIFKTRLRNRRVLALVKYFIAPPFLVFTVQLLYQFATDATLCALLQFRAY